MSESAFVVVVEGEIDPATARRVSDAVKSAAADALGRLDSSASDDTRSLASTEAPPVLSEDLSEVGEPVLAILNDRFESRLWGARYKFPSTDRE